ncbi:LAS17-binding protein 4 [Cladobotryum mycophilum]|uniref:LAS17-binding protein 4 n=1 Tax=Cladobotryum mycophilum TaxID=491253 RepID=A0ABR0S6S9_9HYPO
MRVGGAGDDAMYNDVPVYDESRDDVVWEGRQGSTHGEGVQRNRAASTGFGAPSRSSTWQDDVYDRQEFNPPSRSNTYASRGVTENYQPEKKVGPGRPSAPKPLFGAAKQAALKSNEAVALFNFDPDQPGDLGFKKGDIITILKKTESDNDWWTGRLGAKEGVFPSNYVKMKE